MVSKQCSGMTKKGSRCLKKVTSGDKCYYHLGQNPGPRPQSVPPRVQHAQYATSMPLPKKLPIASSKQSPFGSPKKNFLSTVPHSKNSSSNPILNNPPVPSRTYRRQSPSRLGANPKPGYIYVYTLAQLLNKNNKGDWLKTRNLLSDPKNKDKWINFNARELNMLLVKVGMTTQTVAKRILQWEAKCNHKIECLYPNAPKDPSKPSLLKRLERLSLKNWSSPTAYQSFQPNAQGFFVPRDVMRAEKDIHDLLKLKFGRGDVYCTGCVAKAQEEEKGLSFLSLFKKKEFVESDYNVHVEWFPIPKKQMSEVYRIIDSVCLRYLP